MTNSNAIINFMYFGHNYESDFIIKVFGNHLGNHLQSKFNTMYSKYGTLTFFRWYMELDNGNKELLNNWIEQNYKSQID